MSSRELPVRETMCGSCPFREGSKYEHLREHLAQSSESASRICHATGTNAIGGKTRIAPHICRGSRELQLHMMQRMGVIDEATDESWNKTRVRFGMKPQIIKDPKKKT